MFVSQKMVAGVNPMTDRKVGICPKVQPGTSRTLSEIHTAALPRVSAGSVELSRHEDRY